MNGFIPFFIRDPLIETFTLIGKIVNVSIFIFVYGSCSGFDCLFPYNLYLSGETLCSLLITSEL